MEDNTKYITNKISESCIWDKKKQHNLKKMLKSISEYYNQKYNMVREQSEITYDKVQEIFEVIWEVVISLKKIFHFDYCRIYSNCPSISESKHSIEDIGEFLYDQNELTCNFSKVNLSMSQCKSSLENEGKDNPLLCLSNDLQEISKCNVALACENLFVLFGISGFYSIDSETNFKYLRILFREIGKLFLHMCTDLEHISTLFINQQYVKALHMYRHDCAHLAQRIKQNNRYYCNRDNYEKLSSEKKDIIYRDINSIALLMQHLSDNIGLLLGHTYKIDTRYYSIHICAEDEFIKWREMYRLELKKKNLRIFNDAADMYKSLTYNTDKELFELMLFNLIDNAIKYSHCGTSILIEFTPNQVIIRNYGIEIENGRRPYDLYYRNEKNMQTYLGNGIGLYASKRAADLLNLKLHHVCEKVSDYNLSYVNEAISKGIIPDNIDFDVAYKQLNLINRNKILTPKDYYESSGFSSLSYGTICKQISIPTYCVTFVVSGLKA